MTFYAVRKWAFMTEFCILEKLILVRNAFVYNSFFNPWTETSTLHMKIPRSLIHEPKQAHYTWIYLVLQSMNRNNRATRVYNSLHEYDISISFSFYQRERPNDAFLVETENKLEVNKI